MIVPSLGGRRLSEVMILFFYWRNAVGVLRHRRAWHNQRT